MSRSIDELFLAVFSSFKKEVNVPTSLIDQANTTTFPVFEQDEVTDGFMPPNLGNVLVPQQPLDAPALLGGMRLGVTPSPLAPPIQSAAPSQVGVDAMKTPEEQVNINDLLLF